MKYKIGSIDFDLNNDSAFVPLDTTAHYKTIQNDFKIACSCKKCASHFHKDTCDDIQNCHRKRKLQGLKSCEGVITNSTDSFFIEEKSYTKQGLAQYSFDEHDIHYITTEIVLKMKDSILLCALDKDLYEKCIKNKKIHYVFIFSINGTLPKGTSQETILVNLKSEFEKLFKHLILCTPKNLKPNFPWTCP